MARHPNDGDNGQQRAALGPLGSRGEGEFTVSLDRSSGRFCAAGPESGHPIAATARQIPS